MAEKETMVITQYTEDFHNEVVGLILDIQNNEARIGLSIEEQPDLTDIASSYMRDGGNFWIALTDGHVVGCVGLMNIGRQWGALKKFFVHADFRSQKVGLALYSELLDFAKSKKLRHIILDTPSVATRSHAFYQRAGFRRINKDELTIPYSYPDRESRLYRLDL